MVKSSGILKQIANEDHVIFNDEKLGDIYVGALYSFSQNIVGQSFSYDIIERFSAGNIEVTKSGEWKLIDIIELMNSDSRTTYFFKHRKDERIINVTFYKVPRLNEGKLGDFFNITLYKSFKVIIWYPIKTDNFIPVTIVQILHGDVVLAKTDNDELVSFSITKDHKFADDFLGKKIYVQYMPKYIAKLISSANDISKVYNKEQLQVRELITLSNFPIDSKFFQTRICGSKLFLTSSEIWDINLSTTINVKTIDIYFTREVKKAQNGKYKLSGIINLNTFNLYIFVFDKHCYAVLVERNPKLSGLIGENFDFDILDLKIVNEIVQSDQGKYTFKSIIDNKYIFEDENKLLVYTLLRNTDTPADSNVGKKFVLDLIPFTFMYSISNVK